MWLALTVHVVADRWFPTQFVTFVYWVEVLGEYTERREREGREWRGERPHVLYDS